jgi:hypothetical protein
LLLLRRLFVCSCTDVQDGDCQKQNLCEVCKDNETNERERSQREGDGIVRFVDREIPTAEPSK